MTASTPPLVDVIAEVLENHSEVELRDRCWTCICGHEFGLITDDTPADVEHRDHQARAVLDALERAGGVEWGVFRRGGDQHDLPLDNRTFTTEAAARKWVGRIYNDLSWLEIRSRHTAPWTVVEG